MKQLVSYYCYLFNVINNLLQGIVRQVKVFASQKSKKVRSGKTSTKRILQNTKLPSKEGEDTSIEILASEADDYTNAEPIIGKLSENNPIPVAARSCVLQACTFTSGFLFAFGALIRQVGFLSSSFFYIANCCKVLLFLNLFF